ncbi:Hypothetical protein, predicted transmembrane protein [Mycoplasma yeatsii 13926]|uniref:Uncharacterized protein n=1 Tax=Mycoplasma yeatsii 13926 TaxID=1188240 RepID=S6G8N8_9MOLU|nr:hypothetical protein [Mycoplasma yeatsii]EOA07564.1 Hypothetical protein, predicted transmembrane protein [Mycoplasma yeatsii 13926]
MKLKYLFTLFTGLAIGSLASIGTMYSIKLAKENNNTSNLKILFEKQLRESEKLKQDLESRIRTTERIRKDLETEVRNINSATQTNIQTAKIIYQNVVKLTKKSTNLESRSITYYLAFLNVKNNKVEINFSENVKTQLDQNEKEIPISIDKLLESGLDFKNLMNIKEDYNNLLTRNKITAILTISNNILDKVEKANSKIMNHFQSKVNELNKLKEDIAIFDEDSFVMFIGTIDSEITKDSWKAMSVLNKFIKIKELLIKVKNEHDNLSADVQKKIKELEALDKMLKDLLEHLTPKVPSDDENNAS